MTDRAGFRIRSCPKEPETLRGLPYEQGKVITIHFGERGQAVADIAIANHKSQITASSSDVQEQPRTELMLDRWWSKCASRV